MRFLSLFTGIGGFDLGFERAGMECIGQVENDKHCIKVLSKRWPNVRRLYDVKEVKKGWRGGPIDLVCGGFPCQDVSIAGKRKGLAGERSGLWYEFHRILRELKPRWAVIENVPGLLSSNEGRDFAVILSGMAECGYSIGWRILDAKYFGVPQRRRRVFIVGYRGDGRAAKVLFETGSGGWNPAPRAKARQAIAAESDGGANGHSRQELAATLNTGGAGGAGGGFRSEPGQHLIVDDMQVFESRYARNGRGAPDSIAPPLKAENGGTGKGDGAPLIFQSRYYTRDNRPGGAPNEDADITNAAKAGDSAPLLIWEMAHASEAVRLSEDGLSPTLQQRMGTGGNQVPLLSSAPIMAVAERGRSDGRNIETQEELAYSLNNPGDGGRSHENRIAGTFGVRRLMPIECERLQGFPDGWTAGQADSHRYRQLGNAVAVDVAHWLGWRIMLAADAQ